MVKLTKKYEDGSYGVADNLPVGENSYEFKNLLIRQLGMYEHSTLVPAEWIPADREVPGLLYDWVLCKTNLGLPHIGELRKGKWWFMDCDLGPAEEILNLTVTGWMPIPEDEK